MTAMVTRRARHKLHLLGSDKQGDAHTFLMAVCAYNISALMPESKAQMQWMPSSTTASSQMTQQPSDHTPPVASPAHIGLGPLKYRNVLLIQRTYFPPSGPFLWRPTANIEVLETSTIAARLSSFVCSSGQNSVPCLFGQHAQSHDEVVQLR